MAKNKNDQRYKNTEEQIRLVLNEKTREGFVGLTVTEICQCAKIKRSTFYRHYNGVEDMLKTIQSVVQDDFKRAIKDDRQIFEIFYDLLKYIHDEQTAFRAIGDYRQLFREILDGLRPFITQNWNIYRDELNEQMFLTCRGSLVEVISYWFERCDSDTAKIRKYSTILLNFIEEFGHYSRFFKN